MPKGAFALVAILLGVVSLNLQALELTGELTQGSLIRGQTEPGSLLWLNDTPLEVDDKGRFVFGFGRDARLSQTLVIQRPGQSKSHHQLTLQKREYQVQRIDGLPAKMVTPPQAVLERIRNEGVKVAQARKRLDKRAAVFSSFIWPAEGPISGVYGSQRILNGKPKRPHYGVDVAGPVGTPIVAPADGVVTLAEPDLYYSGGTLIIDHGFGVSSTFLHLSALHVTVGAEVKQGQRVADMGATGRVTGAHLDWRMNWLNTRVDPALLVPERP